MYTVRVVTTYDECRDIWRLMVPEEQLSDLWEVRDCFHRQYRHELYFVVAEENGRLCGLLPLSWNREANSFHLFPGETWEGKTWLEQNRLIARNRGMLRAMLKAVPQHVHLRYLQNTTTLEAFGQEVDEIGYFFLPPKYGFSMENYYEEFSHKSAKRLHRELAEWEARDVTYRYDQAEDFELMVAQNVERYGEGSYFSDARFLRSFRSLVSFLTTMGWLRITTVLVGGKEAAVDIGCIYKGTYTLLAGGTNADFPGIAKLINTHHMNWACEQGLERVDFLCGDFNWKRLFHLTENPLYLLSGDPDQLSRRRRTPATIIAPMPAEDTAVGGFVHV